MRKNIANGSDFLPTGLRPLYRIRWQMITSVNLKPVYRSNIDHLRGGAIPPYGVNRTYDTAVRLGGPRWACQSQSFSTSCDWRGHAKSGASPLPTLCQRWHKNKKFGLHNPLHIILPAWCSLSTPAGFVSLAQWASSRHV